ncbi:MAG TPA: hypothetical protein PKY81_15260 [bacterium]|nr:hypothetical protein [bacterium]
MKIYSGKPKNNNWLVFKGRLTKKFKKIFGKDIQIKISINKNQTEAKGAERLTTN